MFTFSPPLARQNRRLLRQEANSCTHLGPVANHHIIYFLLPLPFYVLNCKANEFRAENEVSISINTLKYAISPTPFVLLCLNIHNPYTYSYTIVHQFQLPQSSYLFNIQPISFIIPQRHILTYQLSHQKHLHVPHIL